MAERGGFEPPEELPLHLLSKQAHSTTLASLRIIWKSTKLAFFLRRSSIQLDSMPDGQLGEPMVTSFVSLANQLGTTTLASLRIRKGEEAVFLGIQVKNSIFGRLDESASAAVKIRW